MLLKSLYLKNFRQFKGKNNIDFATDDEKNVTVILGKNTSGKTTLIQSFYWILYGKTSFETSDFLLNLDIVKDLKPGDKAKVTGELNLKHNDKDFLIRREQDYFRVNSGEIEKENARFTIQHKLENGQWKYLRTSDREDTINKILPEDLSDYFFFNGERISEIGENNKYGKKDISEAVESILGLEVLRSTIKHLSGGKKISVLGKLNNSIDSSKNKELYNKKDKLSSVEQKLEKIDNEVSEYKETINFYSDKINELNDKIKNNKPTKELKHKMQDNKIEIRNLREEKEAKRKEFMRLFSEDSPMFFMNPLFSQAMKYIENYDIIQEAIPEMHSKSIEYLIQKGECICGTKIKEGTPVYNNLMEKKKYLPPQSVGTIVRIFMNDLKHYNKKGNKFYNKIRNIYKKIRQLKNKIKELESQNEQFSAQIQDKPDVGKFEKEVRELKNLLQERRKDLSEKIEKKGSLKRTKERLEDKIEELAVTSEKNKFIIHCKKYAEHINEELKKHYNSLERETKRELEKKANSIFNKMYHGERKLTLNDRYEYKLKTPDVASDFQDKADESEGLKTVTSFSFIAGIVSLAREKIYKEKLEDFDEFNSEPFPLVMDAPFSNADEYHVTNVSKILPEVAEQIVMIIMHKDWKHAERVLSNKIERLYELDKISETYTEIRREVHV